MSRRSPSKKRPARTRTPRTGRPRGKLDKAILDKIGPPPRSPEGLALWSARFAAELAWLEARGEVGADLASRLRAAIGAIGRATTKARDLDDEDLDDEEDYGPGLEEVPLGERDEEPLHVDPERTR